MAAITHVEGQQDLSAGATYSGGALPSDGDTLTFLRAGVGFSLTNLNGLAGKDLLTLTFNTAWAASVGSTGQPLQVNLNRTGTGVLDYKGQGDVFSIAGGTSTPTISTINFRPMNGRTRGYLSGAANATLRVFAGAFRVENSASVDVVQVLGAAQVEIMESGSGDVIGNVTLSPGSTLTARRRISGSLTVGPGMTLIYDVKSTTDSGSITLNGGTLIWLNGALVVNGVAGVLDWSRLEDEYALTITEYPGLTERTGPVRPSASRTEIAGGSKKV